VICEGSYVAARPGSGTAIEKSRMDGRRPRMKVCFFMLFLPDLAGVRVWRWFDFVGVWFWRIRTPKFFRKVVAGLASFGIK